MATVRCGIGDCPAIITPALCFEQQRGLAGGPTSNVELLHLFRSFCPTLERQFPALLLLPWKSGMSLSPGLKGTKGSELGMAMGWPDNLSSKGVRYSSHACNDFVGLPWQPTLGDDAIKFGRDVIRNDRRGETKGSKVAVAAGMQRSVCDARIGLRDIIPSNYTKDHILFAS